MTRFLSESLQAPEPSFRLSLQKMEAANGRPNTDIRFSTEVAHAARSKIRELGLDPHDTTAEELYYFLQAKVKSDDALLVKRLRTLAAQHVAADGQVVDGMIHALQQLPEARRHCYALKNSSLKTILRQLPPKKTMKRLGYRSLDSFLKHEPPLSILAAARLIEGDSWQTKLLQSYKKLRPGDFESRRLTLLKPAGKHWADLGRNVVINRQHNLLSLKEAGTLVFLPLPHDVPAGTVTASLSLALHELNAIHSGGTYLQLCQVRPDFGRLVQMVAADEPQLYSPALAASLPWSLLHRFYAQLKQQAGGLLAEPHWQLEDISWHQAEHSLSQIEPAFKFWQNSAHLGVLHQQKPVSFNLLDTALNCCNELPFENRVIHFFQQSLWHELLLRYLKPGAAELAVNRELQPALAEELVQA